MKKKITFLLSLAAVLSSCSNGNIKQKEQYKREIDVLIDYGNIVDNKASVIFSENINLDGVRLLSKNNEKVSHFICGEKLEVYYRSKDYSEIDYVVLDSDNIVCVQLTNAVVPGSNRMDIFPDKSTSNSGDIGILSNNIEYVINIDSTFTHRSDLKMFTKMWGIYKKEDIQIDEIDDHLGYHTASKVELIAVYSFDITNDIE